MIKHKKTYNVSAEIVLRNGPGRRGCCVLAGSRAGGREVGRETGREAGRETGREAGGRAGWRAAGRASGWKKVWAVRRVASGLLNIFINRDNEDKGVMASNI